MRVLRIICLAIAFRSIAAMPSDDEGYQSYDDAKGRNVEREATHDRQVESLASLRDPTSSSSSSSSSTATTTMITTATTSVSRDGKDASPSTTEPVTRSRTSSLPTRRGKRRRRRRKNRPACPTVTPSSRQRCSQNYAANESNGSNLPSSLVERSDKEVLAARQHAAVSNSSSLVDANAKKPSTAANLTVANTDDSALKLIDERSSNASGSGNARDGKTAPEFDAESRTLTNEESEEIDVYDDDNEFEIINASSRNDATKLPSAERAAYQNDYADIYVDPSSSTSAFYDDRLASSESWIDLLTRLFQSLRNISEKNSSDILNELNLIAKTNEDPCQKWLNSWDKLEQAFPGSLVGLPACPCQYPSDIFYYDKIWDERQQKHFRWRDVSGASQRLDIYKPGAVYCVRSMPAKENAAAAQHCCYGDDRRLLTRGSGAGTPNFVSPEVSLVLYKKIDVLPWRLCKGDFSRFNQARPPNNDNNCETNPDDEEYERQINDTKYY